VLYSIFSMISQVAFILTSMLIVSRISQLVNFNQLEEVRKFTTIKTTETRQNKRKKFG
jgi:hypothetical protein